MSTSPAKKIAIFCVVVGPLLVHCATKGPPVSSVVLRGKMDKKIVALNVHLRDHRLGEVAQDVAQGKLEGDIAIAHAMAKQSVPYAEWSIYRAEDGSLDDYIATLRRMSPARCGLVDKPAETAICARAVIQLNQVPISGSEGSELRVQGAAQGSARVEEVLLMAPDGQLQNAKLTRDERSFEATVTPAHGSGLYTLEVLARTGRGVEPAARWFVEVGSASLPDEQKFAPDADDAKIPSLVKQAFDKLNADRQAAGVGKLKWSAKLAELADKRVQGYAKQGAVSPPDQEQMAKLRIEGDRALSRYTECLGHGRSVAEVNAHVMASPSKRRTHLDPGVSTGAIGVARGRAPDKDLYVIEALGHSYNPENAGELRDAIIDRINLARERKGAAPLKVHQGLTRYADKVSKNNMKRGKFFDKDDMGRTLTDAILQDLDKMQFAGSEMFMVYGAEEVTPGATPTDGRFQLVGVGVSRKKSGDAWWVVILVATPEF